MGRGLLWVILYVVALMIPTVLLMWFFPGSDDGVVMEIGKNFALFAFTILVLQVVLAARFKWLDRVYGLDMILRFHRYMAVFALVLLSLPPHSHRRGQFQVETSYLARSALVCPPWESDAPACPGQCSYQSLATANGSQV